MMIYILICFIIGLTSSLNSDAGNNRWVWNVEQLEFDSLPFQDYLESKRLNNRHSFKFPEEKSRVIKFPTPDRYRQVSLTTESEDQTPDAIPNFAIRHSSPRVIVHNLRPTPSLRNERSRKIIRKETIEETKKQPLISSKFTPIRRLEQLHRGILTKEEQPIMSPKLPISRLELLHNIKRSSKDLTPSESIINPSSKYEDDEASRYGIQVFRGLKLSHHFDVVDKDFNSDEFIKGAKLGVGQAPNQREMLNNQNVDAVAPNQRVLNNQNFDAVVPNQREMLNNQNFEAVAPNQREILNNQNFNAVAPNQREMLNNQNFDAVAPNQKEMLNNQNFDVVASNQREMLSNQNVDAFVPIQKEMLNNQNFDAVAPNQKETLNNQNFDAFAPNQREMLNNQNFDLADAFKRISGSESSTSLPKIGGNSHFVPSIQIDRFRQKLSRKIIKNLSPNFETAPNIGTTQVQFSTTEPELNIFKSTLETNATTPTIKPASTEALMKYSKFVEPEIQTTPRKIQTTEIPQERPKSRQLPPKRRTFERSKTEIASLSDILQGKVKSRSLLERAKKYLASVTESQKDNRLVLPKHQIPSTTKEPTRSEQKISSHGIPIDYLRSLVSQSDGKDLKLPPGFIQLSQGSPSRDILSPLAASLNLPPGAASSISQYALLIPAPGPTPAPAPSPSPTKESLTPLTPAPVKPPTAKNIEDTRTKISSVPTGSLSTSEIIKTLLKDDTVKVTKIRDISLLKEFIKKRNKNKNKKNKTDNNNNNEINSTPQNQFHRNLSLQTTTSSTTTESASPSTVNISTTDISDSNSSDKNNAYFKHFDNGTKNLDDFEDVVKDKDSYPVEEDIKWRKPVNEETHFEMSQDETSYPIERTPKWRNLPNSGSTFELSEEKTYPVEENVQWRNPVSEKTNFELSEDVSYPIEGNLPSTGTEFDLSEDKSIKWRKPFNEDNNFELFSKSSPSYLRSGEENTDNSKEIYSPSDTDELFGEKGQVNIKEAPNVIATRDKPPLENPITKLHLKLFNLDNVKYITADTLQAAKNNSSNLDNRKYEEIREYPLGTDFIKSDFWRTFSSIIASNDYIPKSQDPFAITTTITTTTPTSTSSTQTIPRSYPIHVESHYSDNYFNPETISMAIAANESPEKTFTRPPSMSKTIEESYSMESIDPPIDESLTPNFTEPTASYEDLYDTNTSPENTASDPNTSPDNTASDTVTSEDYLDGADNKKAIIGINKAFNSLSKKDKAKILSILMEGRSSYPNYKWKWSQ